MTSYLPHPDSADAGSSSAPRPAVPSVEELRAALARPGQPGSASSQRRPFTLVIALVAAAAAVATAAAVLSRQQQTGEPGAAPAPVSPTPSAPASSGRAADDAPVGRSSAAAASGKADSGLLVAPPPGVAWELFEGVAVPTSRTHGPSQVDGPVQSGFSRTPTGALLAAAQIGVRRIVTPDIDDVRTVNEQQLLPGPGRTAFLELIAAQQDNAPPTGGYGQTAGFQMLAFTPDVAVVSLVSRSPRGVLQASTDTLRWADGDWKVQLPPSGLEQPRVLADLTGYVPWAGVS